MISNWMLVSALFLLAACSQQPVSETGPQEAFDFGGVYNDTVAGTIDRTVTPARPDGPPNIVLIIADDLGWPYLGFLGDENVITPNMDMLGNGGMVFELGHASSNYCRPTLQSLITGLYPDQYETRSEAIADAEMAATSLPDDADTPAEQRLLRQQYVTSAIEQMPTLPRLLSEAGYASHQSGKWWEQSYAHGGFTHGMTGSWTWRDGAELGDRWFFTFMGGSGNEIGRTTMAPVTDFIDTHADEPFFLWYGPALPHTPLNPPQRFYKFYEDRADLSESAKLYYANITWFDWSVGQLLDSLAENRVLDNTLIVYFNDNGWEQPPDAEYVGNDIYLANGGPRGKTSFFETAFRTPVIFYWADEIAAQRDTTTLVNAIDVMPTLMDYAGLPDNPDLPGYSLRPLIEGGTLPDARDHMIGKMTRHRAGTDFRGIPNPDVTDFMGSELSGYYRRDQRWHFVWLPETDETALYDMIEDPGQTVDASSANPDLVAQFKADIQTWQTFYEAPSP
ncbi:sulfatase [Algimonas porphyrae]|uniref:Sulfatase N-terminal domain-containing protein n=1 Tax=Algimonas porphyrae TaxID=1128113 RepID=A0ABQ5V4C4_9PROT|nr:sulfatase-like hydrolase/transferase [Algimonas porphyrae]GLQ21569.1 hypothetical protein GCM10007854_25240 [Algimonas porphyrae]